MENDDHDKNESTPNLQKQTISDSSEQYDQSEDHDQQQIQRPQAPGRIRSYECTFCKRGFSNAQALGGHMNIHRKHKAKLKQSSSHEETTHRHQQLQHASPLTTSYSPRSTTTKEDPDTPTKPSWPWNVVPYQELDQDPTIVAPGALKQVHQLPLFVERLSYKDDQADCQKELSSSEQLDLELRLGPKPKDSPSTKDTTRKFF